MPWFFCSDDNDEQMMSEENQSMIDWKAGVARPMRGVKCRYKAVKWLME